MNRTGAIAALVVVLVLGFIFINLPRGMTNQQAAVETALSPMELTSTAFTDQGSIPSKYTCDVAAPVSPPLSFENIPAGTVSLALIMDDPDVPTQVRPEGVFDHWVMFDMNPNDTQGIPEGGSAGVVGANGRAIVAYAGPCPPPQYEPSEHRYVFKLYALDAILGLPEGATKQEVLDAMEGHILDEAQLIGRYERIKE